jgi:hypothetical protein
VNDFRKYGLLRALAGDGELRVGVCWMLTRGDGRADGSRRSYLERPDRWRSLDPALFDALCRSRLSVVEARKRRLIPGAVFHEELLSDHRAERTGFFVRLLAAAHSCSLIFFDPDNGLDVGSVVRGRKGSSKYLHRDELRQAFRAGHSVLVYQHFPRVARGPYAGRLAGEVRDLVGADAVWRFETAHVLFLLAAQARHRQVLSARVAAFEAGPWVAGPHPQFRVA